MDTAVVVAGAVIGVGIFANPANVARILGEPSLILLARAYPPVFAFLYGVALLFIINGGALAVIAIIFASYLDRSVLSLGPWGVKAVAALALVALTVINVLGVRQGKWTNYLLMAAKVGGILLLIGLAFFASPAAGTPPAPVPPGSGRSLAGLLLTAMVPVMFAYGGWQNCASIAGEIRDPARTLPALR